MMKKKDDNKRNKEKRVKVHRGWKSPKSTIGDGQHIYYNFVKPPQVLERKTPVEKFWIKLEK